MDRAHALEPSPFRTARERAAEREQKREAVLHAAVRMFNGRGFHATSLDDVAASLGVSKPTIYHYLGNKDQVLFECVTRGVAQLRAAADAALASPGSGLERLNSFLRRYAEITMTDFGRIIVLTSDAELSDESAQRFRALKRDIDLAMRELIEAALADGSVAPVDVRLAAFTIAGAINWTARWHRHDGPQAPEEVAAQMVGLLTNGLAPRPEPIRSP